MNKSLRKLAVFSLIAFGVFCFARSMPSSFTHNGVHGVMPRAVASIHSERPALPAASSVKTRAIQDIRVGQRVLAKNPEISNLERRARREEPEFSNWLQLSLEMPKSDGSTLHIEMLRSEEWLRNQIGFVIGEVSSGERQGVSPPSAIPAATANANLAPPSPQTENLQPKTELAPLSPLRPIYSDIAFASVAAEAEGVELVGLTVDLDLPEMGACGTAVITGISTTPEIEQGEGQIVTATFRHPPSNTVLDVVFVDEGTSLDQHGLATAADPAASADVVTAQSTQTETASKPIGVTDNHLFWSEDRGEFIEIGRMEIGERVRTLFGETKILAQKLPRPGPPAEVYNLEVHEEHVYFVGDDGVLAHNTCDEVASIAARVRANVAASRAARGTSGFSAHIAIEGIYQNATLANQMARGSGLSRVFGRFGTRAHTHFETLNLALSNRLRGTGVRVIAEQFRDSAGIVSRIKRAPGTLGVDALVEVNGRVIRGFDLKTGQGWSSTKQTEIARRFGVLIDQIYRR